MKIIEQINIQYYRSIKDEKVRSINELNIFSGKNDVCKSNILKALDLFFNKNKTDFFEDFNKERLKEVRQESVKGKQFIKIQITFLNPGNYSTLPEKFTVSKYWDRLGNVVGIPKDNLDALINIGKFTPRNLKISRRTLTGFLNKIRYTYVPAIRDDRFFFYLLSLLQESLFDSTKSSKGSNFSETIELFNEQIGEITDELKQDFQKVSGIESNLSFPTEIADLFQRLIIDTKSGEHDIPLKLRGDGIRLRYIPTIMNHIANTSKYFELWGFDEPENSCEYSLAKKLAQNFSTNYLNHAQTFISSHSFSFISLDGDKISKYRVYKEEGNNNSKIIQITKANEKHIQEDIGLLVINKQLANLHTKLEEELEIAERAKSQLNKIKKPYLIFEGKTDNILFSLAYKDLIGEDIETEYFLNKHEESNDGGTVGSGAPFIGEFLRNHINKMPTENILIGIFDFDKERFNQLKNLKSQYKKIDINGFNKFIAYKHKVHPNFYAISLDTPNFRSDFTNTSHPQHCHLSTELLFRDLDIPRANREYPTLFDDTIFGFTGKKKKFAEKISEKVCNGENIDFSGFKPTIDFIEKIIENTYTNVTQ
mgnify:CR=1 FL=1